MFRLKAIQLLTPLLKLHSTSWNQCNRTGETNESSALGREIVICNDNYWRQSVEKILEEKCAVRWQVTKNIEGFLKSISNSYIMKKTVIHTSKRYYNMPWYKWQKKHRTHDKKMIKLWGWKKKVLTIFPERNIQHYKDVHFSLNHL